MVSFMRINGDNSHSYFWIFLNEQSPTYLNLPAACTVTMRLHMLEKKKNLTSLPIVTNGKNSSQRGNFLSRSAAVLLLTSNSIYISIFEPPHDKNNKVAVRPAKAQISLGIRPVWSESSLSAWRKLGSLATHWVHSEDSEQTGRMPRLIGVFAGCTLTLLVLSCSGSFVLPQFLSAKIIVLVYRAILWVQSILRGGHFFFKWTDRTREYIKLYLAKANAIIQNKLFPMFFHLSHNI